MSKYTAYGKFEPTRLWDEGTIRIAEYRGGRFRFYFYPNGHAFSVGDTVMVRLRNQHDQPHRYAGLWLEVVYPPTKTRCTYSLKVSNETPIWPEGIMMGGQLVNDIESNLVLLNLE